MFGKDCYQHRNIGFFSDESRGYTYSKTLVQSQPLTNSLSELLFIINNKFKADFNGILVNYYENGSKDISSHADDESELDKIGVIALSYGASRNFRIRDMSNKIVFNLPTEHLQIIQMSKDFQKYYKTH